MAFPTWRNPEVSDETRQEIEEGKIRAARDFEVMQRNREGMVMAMLRKGITRIPTHARLKDGRSRRV